MIDHNLAFDSEFNEAEFFKYHVFASQSSFCFGDLAARADYQIRMDKVLEEVVLLIEQSKDLWGWVDLEESMPFELDSSAILSILNQYKDPQFWSMK